MNSIKYLFIVIFVFGLCKKSVAQVKKDTLRVLFVGNSYSFTSNMPHFISLLSDSTTTKLLTARSATGGASLKDHWTHQKGLKTKKIIREGNYDIVVIQEHSMGTIDKKDDFLNYTKKLCDLAKASGAKPYLYVTWARQKVPQYQNIITEVYREAAEQNNCDLVLVGEAWEFARTLRPDVELFKSDGSHPSHLGAFLTACVFVNALIPQVTQQLTNRNFMTATNREQLRGLMEDPLDIAFCMKVASGFSKH